jgi:hypothetical protein
VRGWSIANLSLMFGRDSGKNVVTFLLLGEKPIVVSPLGAVSKPRTYKLGQIGIMMYVINRHMGKNVFWF